ncbi:MAG: type II secretion system protein GspE, partial [Lachnospiraceae bacterium]|nr:type II secretion system protein GspE [Lachnospiraceae bacterium]
MDLRKNKKRIGDILVDSGVISPAQLQDALTKQKGSGKKLGEFLTDEGIITDEALRDALGSQLNLPIVDLQSTEVDNRAFAGVIPAVLKKHKMFPYALSENNPGRIMLAMADPLDIYAQDDYRYMSGFELQPVVATTRSIMLAISKHFGDTEVNEALNELTDGQEEADKAAQELAEADVNSSPIVMLVKEMIENAVRSRASDIHVEPM